MNSVPSILFISPLLFHFYLLVDKRGGEGRGDERASVGAMSGGSGGGAGGDDIPRWAWTDVTLIGRGEYRARVEAAFFVGRGQRRHPSGGVDEWGKLGRRGCLRPATNGGSGGGGRLSSGAGRCECPEAEEMEVIIRRCG